MTTALWAVFSKQTASPLKSSRQWQKTFTESPEKLWGRSLISLRRYSDFLDPPSPLVTNFEPPSALKSERNKQGRIQGEVFGVKPPPPPLLGKFFQFARVFPFHTRKFENPSLEKFLDTPLVISERPMFNYAGKWSFQSLLCEWGANFFLTFQINPTLKLCKSQCRIFRIKSISELYIISELWNVLFIKNQTRSL